MVFELILECSYLLLFVLRSNMGKISGIVYFYERFLRLCLQPVLAPECPRSELRIELPSIALYPIDIVDDVL